PNESAFAADGAAPALVAIEMAAQAAGVFEALRRGARSAGTDRDGGAGVGGGGPRLGYLVGARDVRFASAAIAPEVACTAAARLAGAAGALSSYDFEVTCPGSPIAAGRVSTWLTATTA